MPAPPESLASTQRATDAYTAAQPAPDAPAGHGARTFRLWRRADGPGEFRDYTTEAIDGRGVRDAVQQILAEVCARTICRYR